MSQRYLSSFFKPSSIAVFGASKRPLSLGTQVLRNLRQGRYPGKLYAVNPRRYWRIEGMRCYGDAQSLPEVPELAVLCVPGAVLPDLVHELGNLGVKAALILTGGPSRQVSASSINAALQRAGELLGAEQHSPEALEQLVKEAAQRYDMRLLGPNCIGLVSPVNQLNASYVQAQVPPGNIAFIGQSGSLGMAMLDLAQGADIGFSHALTLGSELDVSLADMIDYLATDPHTQTLCIHLEEIPDTPRFLSALRQASKRKRVLALKSDNNPWSPQIDELPGLLKMHMILDEALSRAGVLRLARTDEVFDALEILSRAQPLQGERLAIISNGVGPSLLALDCLAVCAGALAPLDTPTQAKLCEQLPKLSELNNPLILPLDASPEDYAQAIASLALAQHVDAVLVLHVSTFYYPAENIAQAIIQASKAAPVNVLTAFLGEHRVACARSALQQAGVPSYASPDQAIQAFMYLLNHRHNQTLLSETPPLSLQNSAPDRLQVKAISKAARLAGRDYLLPCEVRRVLEAYKLPCAKVGVADDEAELLALSAAFPAPWAVKILSSHHCRPFYYGKAETPRQRWRGVHLGASDATALQTALQQLRGQLHTYDPQAEFLGFGLQSIQFGLEALRLSVGVTRHPQFGPVLLFGLGGNPSVVLQDRQVALPPLNLHLARLLIQRSQAYQILQDHSPDPEADIRALGELLLNLSQLVIDVPEIEHLEINPLALENGRLLALDGSISLGEAAELALSAYPEELQQSIQINGETLELRPIRAEDEPAHLDFVHQLSPESVRLRFFRVINEISHKELVELTQIDYAREMAFIISRPAQAERPSETLGVVRSWTDADNQCAEWALVVRDDWQRQGLGVILMQKMLAYCRLRGTQNLFAQVLADNTPMLALAKKFGFRQQLNLEEQVVELHLALEPELAQ